jgi:hypothetical protein
MAKATERVGFTAAVVKLVRDRESLLIVPYRLPRLRARPGSLLSS